MPKRKTNVQIIKDIMEHSQYGALAQAFVIDALSKWSDKVAASTPDQYPENGIVHPPAWIGVAKEIKGKLDSHYGD